MMTKQRVSQVVVNEAIESVFAYQTLMDAPVGWDDILAQGRDPYLMHVRSLIAYVLKTKFDLSYPRIGALLERDHTSVINQVRKIQEIKDTEDIVDLLDYIDARLARLRRQKIESLMAEVEAS